MINSVEEFVRLRLSTKPEEYMRANEENAPDAVWLEVIKSYPDMKKWVATNESVPAHILDILANDDDDDVRYTAARNHNVGVETLWSLSKDPDESVRQRVAANPNTPVDLLKFLEKDPWENVVEIVKKRLSKTKQGSGFSN